MTAKAHIPWLAALFAIFLGASCRSSRPPSAAGLAPGALPLRWGFDDIGFTVPGPWHEASLTRHPRGADLMRELGFDFWLMWYPDAAGSWSYDQHRAFIRGVDAWCSAQGLDWMPNTLSSLWNHSPEHRVDPYGYDWFCRPDGRRFFLFPDELLAELGRCRTVVGVMYDEAEHHQNNANAVPGLDRPAIFDPAGWALAQAADAHTAAVGALVAQHQRYGLRLFAEHVTPVMFHTFARAGCATDGPEGDERDHAPSSAQAGHRKPLSKRVVGSVYVPFRPDAAGSGLRRWSELPNVRPARGCYQPWRGRCRQDPCSSFPGGGTRRCCP